MSNTASPVPLRVAIVGSGPAGFYTAEHLQRHAERDVSIDMFDRLPTPFGLVRGGVAPDHSKIKSVTKVYEKIASRPGFRFYGCVEFGRDLTIDDVNRHYHALVLAVGAPQDRRMGIPGEDLPGSASATDFVAWYNSHPDYRDLDVDLSGEHVVVVGNGNVAVDVARILATPVDILAATDIADHALEKLRSSRVRTITMLGRRGPAQAAFTPKEIRELGEIPGVALLVDPSDLDLDDVSARHLDEDAHRVLGALAEVAGRTATHEERIIQLRFLTSPRSIVGEHHVREVVVVSNVLRDEGGSVRAIPTEQEDIVPASLVLRAVGYRGQPVPGFPFDESRAIIPNVDGRVAGSAGPGTGLYVSGWIKRGPQGVIGTNKADAGETVATLIRDLESGLLPDPPESSPDAIEDLIRLRVPHVVSWGDWCRIDAAEREAGEAVGRPRRKFSSIEEMLGVLGR